MPCLGDTWDAGLEPGTPEYAQEESRVRAKLEAVAHVINYYCTQHGRDADYIASIPIDATGGLFSEDKDLLKAIYHHLRCDGIKAPDVCDLIALAGKDTAQERSLLPILDACVFLMRSRMERFEGQNWEDSVPTEFE